MLADGRGICDGRLEIFYNGSWGTVCDDSWDLANVNVVCRQLQCKSPANATAPVSYGPGNGHIWLDDVHCKGNESSLLECGHQTWGQHNCRHKEDVGVHCSEFKMLRLTDGCSGQLQVFYNNSWGSVCANDMDKSTAAMICEELDCDILNPSIKEGLSKLDPDPKWLDNVQCRGHEASIWQCPSSPWGKNTCTQKEVAELYCSGVQLESVSREASPDYFYEDSWGIFSYFKSLYNRVRNSTVIPSEHLHASTEPHALRLVRGTNNCSGRVELQYGDTWGTVCDDDWDLKDVEVVCRQLQCGKAVTAVLEFGGGSGIIWLNKVRCRGSEAHLWDCRHEPLGKNDCEHKEDAGVYCSGFEPESRPAALHNLKIPKEQLTLLIVCITFGALLFLLSVLLFRQLQRNRVIKKGMVKDKLHIQNAVYEEIDYRSTRLGTYAGPGKGSFLSDNLPYDYEDVEDSEQDSIQGGPLGSVDAEAPGYDDTAFEKTENLSENIPTNELPYNYDDVEEPLEDSLIDSDVSLKFPMTPDYDDVEAEHLGEQ